jgi:phage-related minor tail protein
MELNQALAAGPRGSSGFIEARAAQAGADVAVLKPMLDQLKAMEEAQKKANTAMTAGVVTMDAVGMSAKQTAFALRGVPAQFTDIVTSLASGQRPMQVLIQQGGQLKDMFGGVGPAARALGGYIAGLVNPFTITAAVVGVFAVAAHQGAKELREFQNAATLTGNAVGLTNTQFGLLRDAVAGIAGTKGKAAESLTAIAQSGLSAGDNIRGIAEAAILMEKATGQAIGKTVEIFKDLQRSPAEAAAKLIETQNLLTGAIYAQIKALEDQGRVQEAANLAERAAASELRTRAQAVVENAGFIEKAWSAVAGAAKGAWDAMLGVGRQVTNGEQIALLQRNLQERQERNRTLGIGDKNGDSAMTAEIKVQIDLLRENERMERRLAELQADRARSAQAEVGWQKIVDENLNKREKREQEIAKIRAQGLAAGKTEAEIQQQIARARERFQETTGEGGIASQRAARLIAAEENRRLQASISSLDFSTPTKLTDAERKVIEITEELKGSMLGVARANKERELAAAKAAVQDEKSTQLLQQQYDATKKAREEVTKQTQANDQLADSFRQQAGEQRAVAETFGKSEIAVKQYLLAQTNASIKELENTTTASPAYIASQKNKKAALEELIPALQAVANKQQALSNADLATQNANEAQILQLELTLVGQTQEVRQRIIEQRRIELDYAKKIADIDKLNLNPEDAAARKAELTQQKTVALSNAAQKSVLDEWQRTADSINNSLTDALLRGFESGKGFARNLRDTLKNMFQTLVLRPVIQAVLAPVSGTLAGIGQQIGGSITGGGGSMLGNILPSGFNIGGFGASQLGFLGTVAVGGSMVGSALGQMMGLKGAQMQVASIGGSLLGGIPGALLGSLIAPGGGPKNEGVAGPGMDWFHAPNGSGNSVAEQLRQGLQDQFSGIAKALGGNADGVQFGVGFVRDPKGNAPSTIGMTANRGSAILADEFSSQVGRSDEEFQQAFTAFASRTMLRALQSAHIDGIVGKYLDSLGNLTSMAADKVTEALARVQKIATERSALDEQLYVLTHTAEEKVIRDRQRERDALDELNRALYDHVAALTDLRAQETSLREQLASAYQTEADALRGVIERHTGFAKQLRDLRDSLLLQAESPLTRRARTAFAGSRFDGTLSSAVAGNEDALQALGGTGTDFLEAAKASARTPAELAAVFAKVMAGLTTAAASADGRVSTAQQQLDAMTQQLTALGVLNNTVKDVGSILASLLDVQNKITQEQLKYAAAQAAQTVPTASATPTTTAAQETEAQIRARLLPAFTTTTPDRYTFSGDSDTPTLIPGATIVDEAGLAAAIQAELARRLAAVPAFAVGGLASGVSMVGERGIEIADFQTPARVYTNEQTRGMFGSQSAQVDVLREVKSMLATLIDSVRRGDVAQLQQLSNIADKVKKWDIDGQPPVRVTA